jgi:hypothetical protein
MNKEFIPYEQALELKELGFDEPCMAFYEPGNKEVKVVGVNQRYNDPSLLTVTDFCAPLYQQAFRWFREKYHLIGGIEYIGGEKPNTTWWDIYVVGHYNVDYKEMSMKYQPYEEAELACLKKLIEILKNK